MLLGNVVTHMFLSYNGDQWLNYSKYLFGLRELSNNYN